MPTQRREVAAQALKELWQELELEGEPLIFSSPLEGKVQAEHHPMLLDQLVAGSKQDNVESSGQLTSWERLPAPSYAQGIAAVGEVNMLLKANMLYQAGPGDRGTIPAAPYSWICYTFAGGWKALSVYFYDNDRNESLAVAAVPAGHQDEWLAFLQQLENVQKSIWRRERRGRIEIIGGGDEVAEAIKKASLDDVVLPAHTMEQMAAQRRIFAAEMLQRYEALRVPRLRKVLLIGPLGTGKTTLLKAEGAHHVGQGGLVFYISPPAASRNSSPWQQLTYVLDMAAESELPTLVLVEDFEVFVSNPQELQMVLNTLDGLSTPDNPAGTLLLATSSDPEKIDQRIRDRPGRIDVLIEIGLVEDTELATRFLKHFLGPAYRQEEHAAIAPQLLRQPGSHFREVCLVGTMHALEKGRAEVRSEDLLWAHDMILKGQAIVEALERFSPSTTRKRGTYFGRNP